MEVLHPEASMPFPEDLRIEEEAGDSQAWEKPLIGRQGQGTSRPPEKWRRGYREDAAGCPVTAPVWEGRTTADCLVKWSVFVGAGKPLVPFPASCLLSCLFALAYAFLRLPWWLRL